MQILPKQLPLVNGQVKALLSSVKKQVLNLIKKELAQANE